MKFLFIAPRLHSNFQYQVKALVDGGHQVNIFCLYSFSSEDYSVVQPRILGYSRLSNLLNKLAARKKDKLTKTRFELNYGFPPIFNFIRQFRRVNPDVVVVKNLANAYSIMTLMIGRIFRKKLIVLIKSNSVIVTKYHASRFNLPDSRCLVTQ